MFLVFVNNWIRALVRDLGLIRLLLKTLVKLKPETLGNRTLGRGGGAVAVAPGSSGGLDPKQGVPGTAAAAPGELVEIGSVAGEGAGARARRGTEEGRAPGRGALHGADRV